MKTKRSSYSNKFYDQTSVSAESLLLYYNSKILQSFKYTQRIKEP